MTKLTHTHGIDLEEPQDIKSEVKGFYERLYKFRETEKDETGNLVTNIPTLPEKEKASLEGEITLEEAGIALKKHTNNRKSPGTDGCGAECFKYFGNSIDVFVVRSLNEAFREGELSTTQKEGIITCIPKGDKPKEFI